MFVRRNFIALLLLALVAAAVRPIAAPAQQNALPDRPDVEAALRREGLSAPTAVQRRGGLWVAEASLPDGRRVRAVMDAHTGELTGLRPLVPAQGFPLDRR